MTKELEQYYYKVEMPKVRKKIGETKEQVGIWGKADRWSYLLGIVIELESQISHIYLDYQKALTSDAPYLDRGLMAARLEDLKTQKEKALREICALENAFAGRKNPNEVTNDMIERAKAFPINDLIEVKRGMALCPFHADRNPSMGIKHNRFNCFACGAKGDVIEFVMKRDGLTFIEAIKHLS